jgi:cytochrome c peroxidase
VGCAVCHVPDLGGVKGIYTDFLLYALEDPPRPGSGGSYETGPSPLLGLPERPDSEPKSGEWKTPALWGVADSAPYMHDGSAQTLRDAILKHGGNAKSVRDKFQSLGSPDQAALIAFLESLKAPPDALPLSNPAVTKLDRK